jgi:hypothetical protein
MANRITLELLTTRMPIIHDWLKGMGAEVLVPTNEWEVLRWRAFGVTHVIYRKQNGSLTFGGDSLKAINAYLHGHAYKGGEKTKPLRVLAKDRLVHIRTVRARDGDRCFWCGLYVTPADATVDHLVPLANKGPNHIGNYVLMHRQCNNDCGHLSAAEKIKAHVEWHMADSNFFKVK